MTTKAEPRLAIIGCGAIVQHHLLPALLRIGWRPSVLVDTVPRNLEATARIAGRAGSLRKVGDWRDAAADFDAVVVATPHVLHGPMGLALAEAGKHVFMEKPLAVTAAEARATVAAAGRAGTVLSIGLLRRFLKASRWTRALVQSGTLGRIRRVTAREGFVFNWATSTDGLLRREVAGGGVLMDTGAHTLDQVLWWIGEADIVGYRDDAQGGVEADCVLDLALPGGGIGRIELSRSRELPTSCRIEGSAGFVEVHLSRNEVLDCSDNVRAFRAEGVGPGAFPEQSFPELFSAEFAAFRKSVQEGAQHGVDGAEGVRSVAAIERCYAMRAPLLLPWTEALPRREGTPPLHAGAVAVVTGASGFIGGRLAERLVEQGVQVRCLVRGFGSAVRLARLPVEIRRADLADAAAVDAALAGADYVFHCAYDARSRAQNLAGTRNLIASSVRHVAQRLVFTSTFSVYEPFPDGPLDEETPDGDTSWVYTRTKLELEQAVLEATRAQGLAGTILQPTIVYGPFSKPWTIAPAEMLLYGTVVLPDRGEGLCNAVHVDDVTDAMILAAQHPRALGERFLVSGPDVVTWGGFFEAFAAALGTRGPEYRPAAEIARQNSGLLHDLKLVASNPKRIVQIAVRVPALRSLLQAGLDALPKPAYDLANRLYYGRGGRRLGQVHLPDPQLLRLYAAMASVDSGKARRLLGYAPRIGFAEGMAATSHYLRWAYGPAQDVDAMPEAAAQAGRIAAE